MAESVAVSHRGSREEGAAVTEVTAAPSLVGGKEGAVEVNVGKSARERRRDGTTGPGERCRKLCLIEAAGGECGSGGGRSGW